MKQVKLKPEWTDITSWNSTYFEYEGFIIQKREWHSIRYRDHPTYVIHKETRGGELITLNTDLHEDEMENYIKNRRDILISLFMKRFMRRVL